MNFNSLVLEALDTPSITGISRMEKDEIPDWVLDNRSYYHLTINGKKCFFAYRDEDSCMLYVDGYMGKPGFDVDNAVYDYGQYMKMFNMSPADLDSYIIKAIKNWEFSNSLSKETRDTFSKELEDL
jgi:hypothetical protein